MKNIYKYLIIAVLAYTASYSQTISISNIDVSNFPTLTSYISILDMNGRSIDNINPDSLRLFENKIDISKTLVLDCKDTIGDPPLSITLVLDKSRSMLDIPPGKTESLSEWLKEGAKAFIDNINFNVGSKVEIIAFSSGAKLLVPFSSNKVDLKNKIDSITFGGGTNYNPPFLDYYVGAIKRMYENTPPNVRRVIVFLTDGDPDAVTPTQVEQIVTSALAANIQIYSITLNMPMNQDLMQIASRTGGKAYPVYTKQELTNVYQTIANEIKTKKICKIIWKSQFSCNTKDKEREVVLGYLPISKEVKTSYTLPNSAFVSTKITPNPVYFDNPDIGTYSEQLVQITPQITDIQINSYNISPSNYYSVIDLDDDAPGIQLGSIIIPKNKTQKIRIRFTPADAQIFRKASFNISGTPCDMSVDLIGGFSKVVLTNPDAGEAFSVCDTVFVSWTGTKSDDILSLYYQEKGSNYWILIDSNVQGQNYSWIPPHQNQEYNIRIISKKAAVLEWVRTFGSVEDENVKNMIVDYSGENIYLIGDYKQAFVLQNTPLSYGGGIDGYLVSYNRDGFVNWALRATGPGDDLIEDICLDSAKNIYITGQANKLTQVGMTTSSTIYSNKYFAYVAKINPQGVILSTYFFDPTMNNPNFTSKGRQIVYDKASNAVLLRGSYSGEYNKYPYLLANRNNGSFLSTLDTNLFIKDIKESPLYAPARSYFVAQDSAKNTYISSTFYNKLTLGGKDYPTTGGSDVYLLKYGFPKFTEDTLVGYINFTAVNLATNKADVDFGSSLTGISATQKLTNFIRNIGAVPVKIKNIVITDNLQFFIKENLVNQVIIPGNSVDVNLFYIPNKLGKSNAKLIVNYDCHIPDTVNLIGLGTCNYTALEKVSVDNTILNKTSTKSFSDIIVNNNDVPIEINPVIKGADKAYFNITKPTGKLSIAPHQYAEIQIQFTPDAERLYTAYIEYNANTECNNDSTLISGTGVNGDIIITEVDFGMKRVMTTAINDVNNKTAAVVIKNLTDVPIRLTNLKFEAGNDANAKGFDFINLPSLPYTVAGADSFNLKIKFTPQNEEKVVYRIIANIEGKTKDYYTNVQGEGFIPKFIYEWKCPPAVKPDSTSYGLLTLKTTNSKSDVFIKDIKFWKNNSSYSIASAVLNIVLAKNRSYDFPVKFTPNVSGTISDKLVITSDAMQGPSENPIIDSIYDVNCEATGNIYQDLLQFDKKVICSNSSQTIMVRNTSKSVPLSVIKYEFSDNQENAFNLNATLPVKINPNEEHKFEVIFTPNAAKTYQSYLKLYTDDNQLLTMNIMGEGSVYQLKAKDKQYNADPRKVLEVPLIASIQGFNESKLDSIKFELKFNSTILAPDTNSPVVSNISNVSWEVSKITSGNYLYSGKGIFNLPINGEIAKLKFKVFLGDTNFTDIKIQPIYYKCTTEDEFFTKVMLSNVCILDYRHIEYADKHTKINTIYPNPIQNEIKINYTVALEAPVKIELYNELGEKISEILSSMQKAGDYDIKYNSSLLGSGTYYIRLNQSEITQIKKIIIVK